MPMPATESDLALLPPPLRESECLQVAQRRQAAGLPEGPETAGIALSGGGIRSATFSLGVMQGLAKMGLLKHFDYLSTVSGGSYTGSFLGALFCQRASAAAATVADLEQGLAAPLPPKAPGPRAVHRSVKWLRENGRYLTPGGSGDLFWAGAIMLRNLLAVHAVLSLLVLFLLLAADRLGHALGARRVPEVLISLSPRWQIFLSPWLLSALGPLVAGLGLFGAAYWLIPQSQTQSRSYISRPLWGAVTLWVWTLLVYHFGGRDGAWAGLKLTLTLASLVFAAALGFLLLNPKGLGGDPWGQNQNRDELTGWLRAFGLILALGLVGYGLVDSAGWTLWHHWFRPEVPAVDRLSSLMHAIKGHLFSGEAFLLAAAAGLILLRTRVQAVLGRPRAESRRPRALSLLAKGMVLVLVAVLVLLGLGSLSALAHQLSFQPAAPGQTLLLRGHWQYQILLMAGMGILMLVVARIIGFLNLSTLGPTYATALTRSYLGASNPARHAGNVAPHLIQGDDMAWWDYRPWARGGPLHIINMTLNETSGGKSQVTQKDRKGMILAVGPAGYSVGVQHHAQWGPSPGTALSIPKLEGHQVFQGKEPLFHPEALSVGQWVGISGAAASTGMGAHTSLAHSLLLGILNVRLGYWWWSGIQPPWGLRTALEGALPVHCHLLEEWTAHFPGTHSRHWYLSDGGHFENTGGYELLRRRLSFILLCDNGADPERELDDLSNLVLKARLDLGAEIRILDEPALRARFGGHVPTGLGSLDQLRSPKAPALAALAEVDYLDASGQTEKTGLMLILKPTRSPAVPLDLQAYQRVNPSFPQQTTADQFFDEAQWESYRRLGEFVATQVLAGRVGSHPSTWFSQAAAGPAPSRGGPSAPQAKEAGQAH